MASKIAEMVVKKLNAKAGGPVPEAVEPVENGADEAKMSAVSDMMAALKSDNPQLFKDALEDFTRICYANEGDD